MKFFKLPDLGEGLAEAEIVEWKVSVGDTVSVDQVLLSVETAKALVDVPSPVAGVIARLCGQEGDILHIGAPLVEFEGGEDDGTVVARSAPISSISRIISWWGPWRPAVRWCKPCQRSVCWRKNWGWISTRSREPAALAW